jgi:hypothetical protein
MAHQLAFPLNAAKNGKANGHHRPPGHRQYRKQLQALVDDLRAAEELRTEQIKRAGELRAAVYRAGVAAGVSPKLLRALLDMSTRSAS